MTIVTGTYATMAWQNSSAYNSAAASAHESRMGGILGKWREMGKYAVVTLLAVCALTFLSHPDFAQQSANARQLIENITSPQIQTQMRIPIAVSEMLPIGIKGLLCAVLIMGVFGGDSTHLHSWGGILVQDVFVALRKKPFTPKQHIRALRMSIIGVATFAFLFGIFFRQTEYVAMWFQVTTGIFVGGAGAAIIGGLYWKKGTTAGAWAAMLTGSSLSFAGILARQFLGKEFPLNGTQIYFAASLSAITVYVVASLLTCKSNFNMDRMLHRGRYALDPTVSDISPTPQPRKVFLLARLLGFDENFTRGDKWIAGALLAWSMFWFVVMVSGSIWNLISPWPLSAWSKFWHVFGIGAPIAFSVITGVWFTWGGIRDIRLLFRRLAVEKVNHLDDGTVVAHHNLDEPAEPAASGETHSEGTLPKC
jgi:SSS family solute:Na+ symporter